MRPPYDGVKRGLDLVVAAAGLVLLAPVIAAVAAVVAATLGRPVLFRQLRPGRDGVPFEIVKFRTMRMVGATDSDRLTRTGRWLRSASLDELPTLVNVVRGEMSLVGPRPLLMAYLDRYTPEQARRHEVRPGVTGLAQVRGRNRLDWPERFAYDVWYVDHRGLALDLRILAQTAVAVLRRDGVSVDGDATAREFVG
jgi:lipopolysaccharide/colanic/teichoic acid biosynthesis glycosyltransferase